MDKDFIVTVILDDNTPNNDHYMFQVKSTEHEANPELLAPHYIAVHIQDQLGSLLLQQQQVVQQNTIYSHHCYQWNFLPEKVRNLARRTPGFFHCGSLGRAKKAEHWWSTNKGCN